MCVACLRVSSSGCSVLLVWLFCSLACFLCVPCLGSPCSYCPPVSMSMCLCSWFLGCVSCVSCILSPWFAVCLCCGVCFISVSAVYGVCVFGWFVCVVSLLFSRVYVSCWCFVCCLLLVIYWSIVCCPSVSCLLRVVVVVLGDVLACRCVVLWCCPGCFCVLGLCFWCLFWCGWVGWGVLGVGVPCFLRGAVFQGF